MTHTRTPLASGSAVSLEDVKRRARVSHDDEDMDLQALIDAAALEIERHAELALLRQRITVTVEAGHGPVRLPVGPVIASADVTVDGMALVNGIDGHMHPMLNLPDYMHGKVQVTYEAGFGDDASAIPADLQLAVADQAARSYDVRGMDEAPQGLSLAAARIAARYRRVAV